MKILLTMAGMGTRFKEAGYANEKFAIELRGHKLLEWSLLSLTNFRDSELVLVTRTFPGIETTLTKCAESLGFVRHRVVLIEHPTRGQAESACLASPSFNRDEAVLIFNTDTYIDPQFLCPENIRGDGWIPTFKAEGNNWSFVQASANGIALRTSEKVRISEQCSVGLYYFSSFFGFREMVGRASIDGELYIAPFYNEWIAAGHETFIHPLPSDAVTVLGTPEELAAAEMRNWPIWPDND